MKEHPAVRPHQCRSLRDALQPEVGGNSQPMRVAIVRSCPTRRESGFPLLRSGITGYSTQEIPVASPDTRCALRYRTATIFGFFDKPQINTNSAPLPPVHSAVGNAREPHLKPPIVQVTASFTYHTPPHQRKITHSLTPRSSVANWGPRPGTTPARGASIRSIANGESWLE